jgi:hypothetical protein
MRLTRVGLAAAVVTAGMLSISGCQEDNNKSANITTLPGGGNSAPPKSQKEFMEAQKAKTGPSGYGNDYPGNKGGPPSK